LFRAGGEGPKAVPLALIARLEEIELERVEQSNDKPVVQYRGKLMPLVDIVEEELAVELVAERPGYIGSAVIAGKATDVIDAGYFLTLAFENWFGTHG